MSGVALVSAALGLAACGLLFVRPTDSRAAERLKSLSPPRLKTPLHSPVADRSADGGIPRGGLRFADEVVERNEGDGRRAGTALRRILPAIASAALGALILGPIGVLAGFLPFAWRLISSRRRKASVHRALDEALPDAVEVLADAMRAKGSLRLAFAEVAVAGPREFRPRFSEVCRRLESGFDIEKAASALSEDAAPKSIEPVLLAISLHATSGGNLAASLDAVASWARGRLSVERELRAATAQGRLSGMVVAVAPIAFALVAHASGIGGTFLLRSAGGLVVMVLGVSLDAAGFLWIHRLCQVRW